MGAFSFTNKKSQIDSFFNEEEMYRFQIVYNKNGKR